MSGEGYAQAASQTIQAGTDLYGTHVSASANKKIAKENRKWQRQFAQHGIRWRVADAKAAGLHPLYAMGAPSVQFTPQQIGGQDIGQGIREAGQHIGGAVSKLFDRNQKKQQQLSLQLLESQIGESDARKNLLNSEAARNLQAQRATVDGAGTQLGVMSEDPTVKLPQPMTKNQAQTFQDNPRFIYESDLNKRTSSFPPQLRDLPGAGTIEKIPTEVPTHKKGNRGLVAGEHPGFKEYRLPNGLPIMMPAGDTLSEVLEETPFWMYKSIYELNKRKYGEAWGDKFLEFLWKGK